MDANPERPFSIDLYQGHSSKKGNGIDESGIRSSCNLARSGEAVFVFIGREETKDAAYLGL